MATDATGTPTAKGIPKYDTANDAPSGLGFNAAMDAIDTLLDSYASKPSGIASGEVPVWNGTTWVRSSVTRVGPSSLGSGTPDSTKFLRGDGTWTAISATTMGTALPGAPADGDHFVLVDSTTAPTYSWLLRYVAAKASNKWIFIGGAPGYAEVDTSETTASTTYAPLATAGPSFTLPVSGDYIIDTGFRAEISVAGQIFMSYDIGATAAVDADAVGDQQDATARAYERVRANKKTGLTAVALVSKYRVSTGTGTFENRWIRVTPTAVGG